jgi:hypothetical protein
VPASGPLQGVTGEQRAELELMLRRLSELWAELTQAAASGDQDRVEAIRAEIAACRARVETMKRSGTVGSA